MPLENHGQWSRTLPFPLKEELVEDIVSSPIGTASQVTTSIFPADMDEQIDICLRLSANEFTAIASAIDVGRDISHGENAPLVWWTWVRALLGVCGVSCEDIANCIETDADVLAALLARLAENGFVPSPETGTAANIPELSAAQLASEMLPPSYACTNPAQDMAIARAIVRELHENFVDLLEQIELATNTVEAANIATDGVPLFGTLNNVTELADWYIETIAETYQASYTQNVEDELSCAIFCLLQSECSITLNNLLETYATFAVADPDTSSLQAFISWLIAESIAAGTTMVATMHFSILTLFRFGGSVFGDGFNDLQFTIRGAAEWRDYSYEDCDDCPPPPPTTTNFWRLYYDLALSPSAWLPFDASCHYVPNAGYENVPTATANVQSRIQLADIGLDTLGVAWQIKALVQEEWSVDTENSGANDFCSQEAWSGANFTGTLSSLGNATLGLVTWGAYYRGANAGASSFAARSFRFRRVAAGGAANRQAHWVRQTRIVIVGLPDGAGQKPTGSQWWRDTLPATLPEYFED